MKSPDRDAADELIAAIILDICELPDRTSPDDRPEDVTLSVIELRGILERHLSSELATLRRRAAELETGVSEIARLPNHSPLDACAYQGGDIPKKFMREQAIYTPAFNNATERARSIARALLSPPTRKE